MLDGAVPLVQRSRDLDKVGPALRAGGVNALLALHSRHAKGTSDLGVLGAPSKTA